LDSTESSPPFVDGSIASSKSGISKDGIEEAKQVWSMLGLSDALDVSERSGNYMLTTSSSIKENTEAVSSKTDGLNGVKLEVRNNNNKHEDADKWILRGLYLSKSTPLVLKAVEPPTVVEAMGLTANQRNIGSLFLNVFWGGANGGAQTVAAPVGA
jgi:hypothetical protein